MLRRDFTGAATRTVLTAGVNSSVTSLSVADASSYPSGNNPFVVVVDRGTPDEEKILVSSKTSTTFDSCTRGYDNTIAVAHSTSAFVDHVLDALSIQDMNTTTYDNEVLMWMGV